MTPARSIVRLPRLEARCVPRRWDWAERNRAAVAAHWARQMDGKARLFDGRVLLICDHRLDGDTLRVTYFETNYSDFLAWRDFGFPDDSVVNGFAMGALQGADGGFVMGVMGPHTANAGRVYFAAGTPDPADLLADGRVDLAGSVLRELAEETGLGPEGLTVSAEWIVVRDGPKICFLREVRAAEPAEAVAARIRAHLEGEPDPELVGVRVVRGPADIDEAAMPEFLKYFLRWSFGEALSDSRSAPSSH